MEKNLEDLKKAYEKIREKHKLPSYEELNEDFNIEKLVEVQTDLLIRELRKFMADRLFNYLRFIESLLNPVNVPMFVFSITKTIGEQEKEKLSEIYKKLAKKEVELVELDISFDEAKEARFIKESFNCWQEIKKDMEKVIEAIKKNWDSKIEGTSKGYFG